MIFSQKMQIWVNKVNRMICVLVRMWRMEKSSRPWAKHGKPAGRPAGRPARQLNVFRLSHYLPPLLDPPFLI